MGEIANQLPILLAGPLLRRCDPRRVCIWLATKEPAESGAEVFELDDGRPGKVLGRGEGESLRLGANLWVHLISALPLQDAFPTGSLLAYDIALRSEPHAQWQHLGDLDLLSGPDKLCFDGLPLPTFFLAEAGLPLSALHGSCRQLHGHGEDALGEVDVALARSATDLERRPSALFLTGDQIYADDMAPALLAHLRKLGRQVMGRPDEVPGFPPLEEIPIGARQQPLRELTAFTSSKGSDHLLSFSEYAAAYLVSWSKVCWPETWLSAGEALGDGRSLTDIARRRRYEAEVANLERTRASMHRVRRALANVPTYMVFDDHDVTDDWNITAKWKSDVNASPSGRRVVANALASFWAFQGWGNIPDRYDGSFMKTVSDHLVDPGDGEAFEKLLWEHDHWSFVAPTSISVLCLDTRTMRSYDSDEGGARLLGEQGRKLAVEDARDAGHESGDDLVIVSPVPVCGLELQERRQKFLLNHVGPYEIDFEAWHSNLQGFYDFMSMLIEDLGLERCLILSGDVHYGMTIGVRFTLGEKTLAISQLVSSSFKHSGVSAKVALNNLGRVLRRRHERVGWCSPPEVRRSRLADRVIHRAANTDEWNGDAPVVLHPRRAGQIGVTQKPDFVESRLYVRPNDSTSLLVGDNNVGVVSLDQGKVTHTLLIRPRDEVRELSTAMNFTTARPTAPE